MSRRMILWMIVSTLVCVLLLWFTVSLVPAATLGAPTPPPAPPPRPPRSLSPTMPA